MTPFFAIFLLVGLGLVLGLLFKIWGLVNRSLPNQERLEKLNRLDDVEETLKELRTTVTSLQAQIGGDSAFQADLKRALEGLETASAELNQLKGERQSDLKTFTQRLDEVKGQLQSVQSTLTGRRSGLAGENILREALRAFPAEWIRIPYRDVEFGVVLFDRRVIPIDSKFAGTELLERFGRLVDDREKDSLAEEIERRVLNRVREVAKYIDPPATTTFAICAVPDSIYVLLKRAHLQSYQEYRVILLGYSMAVPYLLSLYDLNLKYVGQLDESRLEAFLTAVEQSVRVLKDNLENRVKEADTRLSNAYRDCIQAVGTIEGALAALKSSRMPSLSNQEAIV